MPTPDPPPRSPDPPPKTISENPTPEPQERAPSVPPVIALPEAENGENEELGMAKQLDGAFQAIGDADQGLQKYKDSRTLKVLNATGKQGLPSEREWRGLQVLLGAAIAITQTDVATAQGYASTLKPVYESDAMKTVREGVNLLVDSLPGLVKALDEVAKLHPFIGSAFHLFVIHTSDRSVQFLMRV